MRFLGCCNTRLSAEMCAFVLLLLICTNVQLCKAWWWWTNTSPTSRTTRSGVQFSTPEECARPCQDGEWSKICYYRFVVEYYTAYGRACDYCEPPVNDSKINSTCQCIIGDGFEKTVFSINRMIPGPSIQVCLGDFIIIDVVNEAEGIEVTLHWHGVFQNGYQYYDGVPHVTQCPIQSSNTFRYAFGADNSGTHFYHSHISTFLIDGQYGSLIIREPPELNPYFYNYDVDRPEHVMIISDWLHELTLERYPGRYRSNQGQVAENFLVNGRGDWTNPATGLRNNISLATFIVESGKVFRFRMINACGTVCPILVTIQNHAFEIIATDGEYVEPISANAISSTSGERYDFLINANQTPGYYWIHVQGLGECANRGIYQLALLVYEGSSESSLSQRPGYSNLLQTNIGIFNPVNSTNCEPNLCIDQTRKIYSPDEDEVPLDVEADVKLILSFYFFNYSSSGEYMNMLLNKSTPDYRKFFVALDRSHLVSVMNNITYKEPPGPLISQDDGYEVMCGDKFTPTTCITPCTCTHVYHIPLGAIVDVMIYDISPLLELNHPFHLHGYSFCVLRSGQFNSANDKDHIALQDVENVLQAHEQRIQNGEYNNCSPKDTVIVPNTGYIIMRFKADNPGWWFFHCHFSWHTASGMNVVYHVGQERDLPPVPPDFPECYNWQLSYN